MGTIIAIIIGVAVVGGLIGLLTGDKGEKGSSAIEGAIGGALGCGSVIIQLVIAGGVILLAIWFFVKCVS